MLKASFAFFRAHALRKLLHAVSFIIAMSLLSTGVRADWAVEQEQALRAGFVQAKAGALADDTTAVLRNNILLPWLQAIEHKQNIAALSQTQLLDAINAKPDDPSSVWLLGQWRAELIRRQDWASSAQLEARFSDGSAGNRCALLLSVAELERSTLWRQNALALWLNETKPPAHCRMVFESLNQLQPFSAQQIWQRFDRLLAEGNTEALPELATRLPQPNADLARQYIDFLSTPQALTSAWPADARSRSVLSKGLMGLARKNTAQAEALFAGLDVAHGFSAEQRAAVQSEIALWSMVNYEPGADKRYFAVPEALRSANLREWYMRYLFSGNDDAKTLDGFSQLLPAQRDEARWLYFQARTLERLQQGKAAEPLYRKAAQSASFHGWLAAERSNSAYTFCPLEPALAKKDKAALDKNISLKRALWLWQLGEANYAIWEWNAAYKTLSSEQQRKAIEIAQQFGWYDRAVFSLESSELNQRYYTLRFATPYLPQFKASAARFGLNQSWLMAHARAESIFMPGVTSSANARGLLQLLPSTAEAIALKNGLPWQGENTLYEPDTNILLGAGALSEASNSYPGKAYQAIGAYNAGPTPVNRWQAARPLLEPAFWIETIPYKETREYIARVLAFSMIYDWRLKQPVVPLGQRLLGDFSMQGKSPEIRCPAPAVEVKKR
jgi:soluble lytic murein transglycosylase